MDNTSFFKLSYGLYVVSTSFEGKNAACVVNTLTQVTNAPNQLALAINKENYTTELIEKSGVFAGVVLTEATEMDLIRRFGFSTSRDVDKFEGYAFDRDSQGIPYLTEHTAAHFSCKVTGKLDVGTHVLFVGEAVEGENLSKEPVMTYAYYHQVKNGKTPPKASAYQKPEGTGKKGWKCTVCGYIYEGDTLPPDYVCPICGAPASKFEKR